MLEENMIQIFKVHDVRKASHMVTDVPFWTRQFGLLTEANYQHIRGIKKVVENQTKYQESASDKDTRGKDEGRFFQQVKYLNRILTDQLGKLETDASQYKNIEASLKSFEDGMDETVCKLDHQYKLLMDKLTEQTKAVETYKKQYHKLAFSAEKLEIKARMAVKPDVIYETHKKVEDLKERVAKQIDRYSKNLDKWDVKLQAVQQLAEEYEVAYNAREKARAKLVLTGLQNSIDLTMAGNYAKKNAAFGLINERRFVQDTVIQRETISTPKFQLYTGESNTKPAQTVRGETETKDRVNATSKGSDTPIEDGNVGSSNIPQWDKSNMFVVVKAYERQEINQLNLKAGEHVTQILPANGAGLAYGQVVHGILHKKKKGFYPVSHVVQLQIEAKVSSKVSPEQREDAIPAPPTQVMSADVIPDGKGGGEKKEGDPRRRRREGKRKAKSATIEPL